MPLSSLYYLDVQGTVSLNCLFVNLQLSSNFPNHYQLRPLMGKGQAEGETVSYLSKLKV
jgi:hypothetical protein